MICSRFGFWRENLIVEKQRAERFLLSTHKRERSAQPTYVQWGHRCRQNMTNFRNLSVPHEHALVTLQRQDTPKSMWTRVTHCTNNLTWQARRTQPTPLATPYSGSRCPMFYGSLDFLFHFSLSNGTQSCFPHAPRFKRALLKSFCRARRVTIICVPIALSTSLRSCFSRSHVASYTCVPVDNGGPLKTSSSAAPAAPQRRNQQ